MSGVERKRGRTALSHTSTRYGTVYLFIRVKICGINVCLIEKNYSCTWDSESTLFCLHIYGKKPLIIEVFFLENTGFIHFCFRNNFKGVGWPDATLFYFIAFSFIHTIHSHILTSINIRRGSSPFPHRRTAQWQKPPWGVESGFELLTASRRATSWAMPHPSK